MRIEQPLEIQHVFKPQPAGSVVFKMTFRAKQIDTTAIFKARTGHNMCPLNPPTAPIVIWLVSE
jgi:hypothetical protein